jgi:hypothetical protein
MWNDLLMKEFGFPFKDILIILFNDLWLHPSVPVMELAIEEGLFTVVDSLSSKQIIFYIEGIGRKIQIETGDQKR